MSKPHKHAEFIKAWADGKKIEYNFDGLWEPLQSTNWDGKGKFRIKPDRIYPTTSLTPADLVDTFNLSGNTQEGFLFIVNAAIKQYIIDSEE